MKMIAKKDLMHIAGGVAEKSDDGILVTDNDEMTIQGLVFSPLGQLYNKWTKKVYFDVTTDGDSYCMFSRYLFTAVPVDGGYLFKTGTCN